MNPKIEKILSLRGVRPISQITAYDYPTARILDEAGLDMILVGDSLGMVVMGYPDTTHVRLEDMLHHGRMVARACKDALVILDMPIHTFDTPQQALETARRMAETGVDAVKLEGGVEKEEHIRAIVQAGIPVQAHIGLLPQKIKEEGGYHMKGKTAGEAAALMRDMEAVARAGAFSVVIECTRKDAAAAITAASPIPTIGIGAGHGTCDGEVCVFHDLVGGFPWFVPSFITPKANIAAEISRAAGEWVRELTLPRV